MENNKGADIPAHLLPGDLKDDVYRLMMCYQVANAMRVVPKPEKLRSRIKELVESTAVTSTVFSFCYERLQFDQGIVKAVQRKTAEFYVAGSSEIEIDGIKEYTAEHEELDEAMARLVSDTVAFKQRDARRKGIVVEGVVRSEWHEPDLEPEPNSDDLEKEAVYRPGQFAATHASKELTPDSNSDFVTMSSAEPHTYAGTLVTPRGAESEDVEKGKLQRRDSARQGLVALEEGDIDSLLCRTEICFTIKPSKNKKKKAKAIDEGQKSEAGLSTSKVTDTAHHVEGKQDSPAI
jgi:hypothetical protein